MRVLATIYSLGRGGAEQALVNLLPGLREHGIECDVAAFFPPYDLGEEIEALGSSVFRLGIRHRWDVASACRQLVRLQRQGNYDIVHSQLFFPNLYAGLAAGWMKARLVTTYHSLEFLRNREDTPWRWFRSRLYCESLRRLDGHVAVSSAVANQVLLQPRLSELDIAVIPNALSETVFTSAAQPPASGKGAAFRLALPGRLIPEKGHRLLFAAMDRLRDLPIRVACYGGGPLEKELKQQVAALSLEDRVSFQGALSNRDLMTALRGVDAVVIPSLSEGFGLIAAESMALGLPVIASRIGGLAEVVTDGKTGVLFESGSVGDLAEKIREICLDADLRRRLGAEGSRHALSAYSVPKVAAVWAAYYRRILERNA